MICILRFCRSQNGTKMPANDNSSNNKRRKKTKSQNHRLCHNNEKSWIILYQVRKFAATNGLFSFWVVLNYQLLAFQWQTVSYITVSYIYFKEKKWTKRRISNYCKTVFQTYLNQIFKHPKTGTTFQMKCVYVLVVSFIV